jgi:Fic family protein
MTFLLCHAGVLREPLLYLSLYLKRHRTTYYDLLDRVRRDGDWEAWLAFFLQGVKEVAEEAVSTALRIQGIFSADRDRIEAIGRRASTVLRVHEALKVRPLESMPRLCTTTKLSFPTVSSAMQTLVELGIARELTGKRRNRLFVYDRYLGILSEGVEPATPPPACPRASSE